MSLPNARKITVDGQVYEYLIKSPNDRYGLGWTSPTLRLTIKSTEPGSRVVQYDCHSKSWTPKHAEVASEGWRSGVVVNDHKVEFTPRHIAYIISKWPIADLDMDDWKIELVLKKAEEEPEKVKEVTGDEFQANVNLVGTLLFKLARLYTNPQARFSRNEAALALFEALGKMLGKRTDIDVDLDV